jgi:hypothetical protein
MQKSLLTKAPLDRLIPKALGFIFSAKETPP